MIQQGDKEIKTFALTCPVIDTKIRSSGSTKRFKPDPTTNSNTTFTFFYKTTKSPQNTTVVLSDKKTPYQSFIENAYYIELMVQNQPEKEFYLKCIFEVIDNYESDESDE